MTERDEEALALVTAALDLMAPYAVRVAATLRLADAVAPGGSTAAELATARGADPDALERLLRYLSSRGVFEEIRPGVFAVNRAASLLSPGHPWGMHELLDHDGPQGRIAAAQARLIDTVRHGGDAYRRVFGRPFYEDMAADPELSRRASAASTAMAAGYAGEIAQDEVWKRAGSVADVGGGTGELTAAILRAHPGLRAALVERAETARAAAGTLAAAGVGDRCVIAEGSFFAPLPEGYDVYLLANVVPDWEDDDAVAILLRCAEVVPSEGRVVVVDTCATAGADDKVMTFLDLFQLVVQSGRARRPEEIHRLAERAGLTPVETRRTPLSGYHVIEYVRT
ncbi:methyltransferase [Nonomuraea sp. NPDC048826]|uniref:methyltransferase n=1 Tax=Nonomuraea sp. NPDC048826 TaxID=3364347 RepID=UPI00371AC4F8